APGDGAVRVGDERELQLERAGELALLVEAVAAYAEDLGVPRAQLRQGLLKPARLDRSTDGERLGEEVEHHPAAAQVAERDRAGGGPGGEVRCLLADLQHASTLLGRRRAGQREHRLRAAGLSACNRRAPRV